MRYPIVLIRWEDSGLSAANEGWTDVLKIARETKLAIVTTVGMKIFEDEHVIALVQSLDESDDKGYNMAIVAKSSIKESKVLLEVQ